MSNNYKAWDLKEAVDYYEGLRNKPEDIYESERVFFFPLVRKVKSVLDVGCAAGGIYNIIRSVNPKIKYTGIDVSRKMVESAKKIFPGVDFRVTSGIRLNFPANSFDAVIALGVLNHLPAYRSFIKECYRVSKKYCLIDLPRLVQREHQFAIKNSYMLLKERFHSKDRVNSVYTKVPYVLADAAEVFGFLVKDLKPRRILAKGYFGKPDKSVTIPLKEVCFTVACIEKSRNGRGDIFAEVPAMIIKRLKDKGLNPKARKMEGMLKWKT